MAGSAAQEFEDSKDPPVVGVGRREVEFGEDIGDIFLDRTGAHLQSLDDPIVRTLGSHLARMELQVALEAWLAAVIVPSALPAAHVFPCRQEWAGLGPLGLPARPGAPGRLRSKGCPGVVDVARSSAGSLLSSVANAALYSRIPALSACWLALTNCFS